MPPSRFIRRAGGPLRLLCLLAALALLPAAGNAAVSGRAFASGAAYAEAASPAPRAALGAVQSPAQGDAAADEAEDEEGSDTASPLAVAVRWGEFVALLLMLGAAAFKLLVLQRLRGDASLERAADRAAYGTWHLAAAGAALSALTLVLRLWQQSVMLNGPEDAFSGERLDALLTTTPWGSGWTLQAVASVAFFVGLMISRAPHGRTVGWMGAAVAAWLLAAVPALSGHASAVESYAGLAIAADWLHVAGAGVWLGTLAALMLAGLPAAAFAGGDGTMAFAAMVRAFSPVALCGAGVAGVTGVVSALLHFSALPQLWSTGYGRALLVKLALLALMAGIGFYNWRFVLPSLHGAESPARLRRSAGTELGIGALVLLVTAVLVALSPP
jgi:copper transport protein